MGVKFEGVLGEVDSRESRQRILKCLAGGRFTGSRFKTSLLLGYFTLIIAIHGMYGRILLGWVRTYVDVCMY